MAHLTLYRKWRPGRFEEVLGQEPVVRTLTNALATGRVAHAYLLAGPRGTGKTTLARLVAKGLNCAEGPTPRPCGRCDSCRAIADGSSLDVVEIDGASNRGIDEIRELRERVRFAPARARRRVYIVDEVHMLTHEAFNALLKVLEEPPAHVVFVFATTEPHRVPATILSRCQRFDLRRLTVPQLARHLETVARSEGIEAEPAALELLARHADGGVRDALALLEQCAAFEEGRLTADGVARLLGLVPAQALGELARAYLLGDVARGLRMLQQLEQEGVDSRMILRDLVACLREVATFQALQGGREGPPAAGPSQVPAAGQAASREELVRELAGRVPLARLVAVLEGLVQAESQVRWAPDPRLVLELELLRCAAPAVSAPRPGPVPVPAAVRPPAPSPAAPSQPPAERPGPAAATVAPRGRGSAPAQAPLSLEEVLACWPEVLAMLKGQQRRTAARVEALLREGQPVAVDGVTVVLGFPPDREFHRVGVEEPASRQLIEKALTRLLGRPVSVRTQTLAEPSDEAAPPQEMVPPRTEPSQQVAPQHEPARPPEPPPPPSPPALPVRPGSDGFGSANGGRREREEEFDPDTLQQVLHILGGRLLKELDP